MTFPRFAVDVLVTGDVEPLHRLPFYIMRTR